MDVQHERELDVIESYIQKSALSLAEGLEWFWPYSKTMNSTLKEANIVSHLAHVLLNNSFFVYSEVPFADKKNKNIMKNKEDDNKRMSLDLLAFNIKERMLICLEAKGHPYDPKKVLEDMIRLKDFEMPEHDTTWSRNIFYPEKRFALFATTCTDKNFSDWWSGDEVESNPPGRYAYENIAKYLNKTKRRYSYVLREGQGDNGEFCWRYLYALWDLEQLKTVS